MRGVGEGIAVAVGGPSVSVIGIEVLVAVAKIVGVLDTTANGAAVRVAVIEDAVGSPESDA